MSRNVIVALTDGNIIINQETGDILRPTLTFINSATMEVEIACETVQGVYVSLPVKKLFEATSLPDGSIGFKYMMEDSIEALAQQETVEEVTAEEVMLEPTMQLHTKSEVVPKTKKPKITHNK